MSKPAQNEGGQTRATHHRLTHHDSRVQRDSGEKRVSFHKTLLGAFYLPQGFLGLTPEESAYTEIKLSLARAVHSIRRCFTEGETIAPTRRRWEVETHTER